MVKIILDKVVVEALLLSHFPDFFKWNKFEIKDIKIENENIVLTVGENYEMP